MKKSTISAVILMAMALAAASMFGALSYKKNQRFTESSDELEFTIEHQPDRLLRS